ncbi:MAG: Thiol-disulfide isomerase, partial [Labilithrix sp.]|nr:Thiol-disulfide isomerase [Labilithrix sp.]
MLVAGAAGAQPQPGHGKDELARARALDREGAKAYGEGRYNDAIRYFEEAYRLGGPAFELWNVAKCHLRLDQPEQAAEMLERYLSL